MKSVLRLLACCVLCVVWLAGIETSTPRAAAQSSPPPAASDATRTVTVGISTGWNSLTIPLQTGLTTSDALIQSMNASLGQGAVSAVATFINGRFAIGLPGYAAIPIAPKNGILVLSTTSGMWQVSGVPYTAALPLNLNRGWNLVAAPYPPGGLSAADVASQSSCPVTEVATLRFGHYHVWTSGQPPLYLGNTDGMWILCSAAGSWSPASASDSLPPDPALVAPNLDGSVTTNMADATAFLYSGSNPIQTGVSSGTIDPARVAVLRGLVSDLAGAPLGGVSISVLNHPEYGHTLSRSDGHFDLAVNGGGPLTVQYSLQGYLPVERTLDPGWQDYAQVNLVAMTPYSTTSTTVNLASPGAMQVVQGDSETDFNGTRRPALLVPAGESATGTRPDGSTQTISTATIRVTEVTVGGAGYNAMPGMLPPTSAYTYAVDYSADGYSAVHFSAPIYSYLPNYRNLPVGWPVPAGYYDQSAVRWVPSQSGLVVQIVSFTNGMADLDLTGDGTADPGQYASLQISDAERAQLYHLYGSQTLPYSLWRVPITHFSVWDFNLGDSPPDDAQAPQNDPQNDPKPSDCAHRGSIVGCQSQSLGESVPIAGTPFTAQYHSERTPGRTDGYSVQIPLTGATVPKSCAFVFWTVSIAGRTFTDHPAEAVVPMYNHPVPGPCQTTNQSITFTWDGKDAYGRTLQGTWPATITVEYAYRLQYTEVKKFADPTTDGTQYARDCNITSDSYTLWPTLPICYASLFKTWTRPLGSLDVRPQGLGGWDLNVHTVYEPGSHTLYSGDGTVSSSDQQGPVAMHEAGGANNADPLCSNQQDLGGDGCPAATASVLGGADGLAAAPDGSLYIASPGQTYGGNQMVRKITPDGIIHAFAGSWGDTTCPHPTDSCGDGGPATSAQFNDPAALAVAPDGSVYIADAGDNRIRKVASDGTISTVAGTGATCTNQPFCGDGGPATQAELSDPQGVAVASDGTLYISDNGDNVVRKVALDGTISTVAGEIPNGGASGTGGDGQLATQSQIRPDRVAVGPDDTLYISTNSGYTPNLYCSVLHVTGDGIVHRIAGTGGCSTAGSGSITVGSPATSQTLSSIEHVAVDRSGDVFFSSDCWIGCSFWEVLPDGDLVKLAGNGQSGNADGGAALQATFEAPSGIAPMPDGSVNVADAYTNRVVHIGFALPGYTPGSTYVPSPDGNEIYVYDPAGRHQKTLDALTGATIYSFTYDNNGQLAAITDGSGQTTHINRNVNGNPNLIQIQAPGGQITTLTLGSDGYLASLADPSGNTYAATYSPTGLMQSFTDPNGNVHHMTYDSAGRLLSDASPLGTGTLARTDPTLSSYSVVYTSPGGLKTTYDVAALPSGATQQTITEPDGAKTVYTSLDSTETVQYADGTVETVTDGPDPRWGMSVTIPASATFTTPGGLTSTTTMTRRIQLSDPSNPFSLQYQTDTVVQNGKTSTSTYNASTRTLTWRSAAGRTETLTLDSLGRVTQTQIGDLAPVTYTYDSTTGLLTAIRQHDPAGKLSDRSIQLGYNAAQELTTVTNALGQQTQYAYDNAGRLQGETLASGATVGFGHDRNGNLTALTTPAGHTYLATYTPDGELQSFTAPTVGGTAPRTSWQYNPDDQLTALTLPDGTALSSTYSNGQLQSISSPSITYTYNAAGQLAGVTSPDATETPGYDGFLLTGRSYSAGVAGAASWTLNPDLTVSGESVNGGNSIQYQYDSDGLVSKGGALSITRNADGLVSSTSLAPSSGPAVTTSAHYDTFGGLADEGAAYNGNTLISETYTDDALGRIATRTETIGGSNHTFAYSYDTTGRLAGVTEDGSTLAAYSYDANGNLLSGSASYDAQDKLTGLGGTTYGYDANGRRTSATTGSATTRYTYDALGRLTGVSLPGHTVGFLYDGLGRRIGTKLDGALTLGLLYGANDRPVAQVDGNGTVVARFVYGTNPQVPDYMTKGGNTYRIVSDERGSVRMVVNVADGSVAQRLDYDPWGKVVQDTDPGFQPFGYAGGLYDPTTGLVHFGAREYDPAAARWLTPDPTLFDGGQTNLYVYAGDDPINTVDPAGTHISVNPKACLGLAWDWLNKAADHIHNRWTDMYTKGRDGINNLFNALNWAQQTNGDLNDSDPHSGRNLFHDLLDPLLNLPAVQLTPAAAADRALDTGTQNVDRAMQSQTWNPSTDNNGPIDYNGDH